MSDKNHMASSIKKLIESMAGRLQKGESTYVELPGTNGFSLFVEKNENYLSVEVLNSDAVTSSVKVGGDVTLDHAAAVVSADYAAVLAKAEGKQIEGDEQKVEEQDEPGEIGAENEKKKFNNPRKKPGHDGMELGEIEFGAHTETDKPLKGAIAKEEKPAAACKKPVKEMVGGETMTRCGSASCKCGKKKADKLAKALPVRNTGKKPSNQPSDAQWRDHYSKMPAGMLENHRNIIGTALGHNTNATPLSRKNRSPFKKPFNPAQASINPQMPKHEMEKDEHLSKPYKSDAQRKFFHTNTARKAGISPAMTKEWDQASKGQKHLPEHVHKTGEMPGGAAMPKAPVAPKPASNKMPKQKVMKAQDRNPNRTPGQSSVPKVTMNKMPGNKVSASAPKAPAIKIAKPRGMMMSGMGMGGGFGKSESYVLSEDEIKRPCHICGMPEFKKSDTGYKFTPCVCFQSETKTDDDQPRKFVELYKDETGKNRIKFAPDADPEAKKLFVLLLKSSLLSTRNLK
jgi:hypothetical protein